MNATPAFPTVTITMAMRTLHTEMFCRAGWKAR